jgi:hypothetical protein
MAPDGVRTGRADCRKQTAMSRSHAVLVLLTSVAAQVRSSRKIVARLGHEISVVTCKQTPVHATVVGLRCD